MTAREQLHDAKYLLTILRDKNERTEVRPLLSGLLAIVRSIPDHLLEEYNIKLSLNIPLSEELRIKNICYKAILLNNSRAISFLTYYMNELDVLSTNPLWKTVKKKRDIKFHRSDTPLKKESHRVLSEPPLKIDDNIMVISRDKEGKIKNPVSISPPPTNTKTEKIYDANDSPKGGVKWFFIDDPSTDIVSNFTQLLKDITVFVDKIEAAFP